MSERNELMQPMLAKDIIAELTSLPAYVQKDPNYEKVIDKLIKNIYESPLKCLLAKIWLKVNESQSKLEPVDPAENAVKLQQK